MAIVEVTLGRRQPCQLRRYRPGWSGRASGGRWDPGVVSRRWWSSVVRAWISRVIWVFVFSSVSGSMKSWSALACFRSRSLVTTRMLGADVRVDRGHGSP